MTPSSPAGFAAGNRSISGYNLRQLPQMNPQQMRLFEMLLGKSSPGTSQGLDYLSQLAGGEEGAFEQMEAPAYSAFNRTLGDIGNRYAQFGALGSSGFQNALAGAGSELSENLQSRRSQLQLDALQKLLGISEGLLGKSTFENILVPKRQRQSSNLLGNILGSAGGILGGSFLGPIGGALGGGVANILKNKLFG